MGLEIKIEHDNDTESPREWENTGTMLCAHRRYTLGDVQIQSGQEGEEWKEDRDVLVELPLYLYDHGGLALSTKSFIGRAHHAEWDSGQLGIIVATRESVVKAGLDPEDLEKIEAVLVGEVATYHSYISGDVFWVSIRDENNDIIESLGGVYGYDYAETCGNEMLEALQPAG